MEIERVAIIGAGPCGLGAAKYLIAEKKFKVITIFEQRDQPGGVWNYTGDAGLSNSSTIQVPNAIPRQTPQEPVNSNGTFVSPVYDALETNIPNSLMQFCDSPFPSGTALFPAHSVVRDYLHTYAEELRPYIQFQAQVLDIFVTQRLETEWAVKWRDLALNASGEGQKVQTVVFDAVIIANGHHNELNIPNIPGLSEWHKTFPGSITHSALYRCPEAFADKKTLVVGHSASGIDIASQISSISKHPVLISERTPSSPSSPSQAQAQPAHIHFPEITHLDAANHLIHFTNGHIEADIANIIFCTGYHFSLPFLPPSSLDTEKPIITTGSHPHNLYNHIFYTAHPTLAFIGTPQRIVPFPFSQAQAAYTARVFAGRVSLPPQDEMERWVDERGATNPGQGYNEMKFPADVEYINRMYELCMGSGVLRREGLENGGLGMEPPVWGAKERWVRGKFPAIKEVSRGLGEARKVVTSLEELGPQRVVGAGSRSTFTDMVTVHGWAPALGIGKSDGLLLLSGTW
ncbi:hypothetical protein BJY04DRAFT_228823 [Aspergillus karnatakaensis]|uniref:uncharacterized protein n=1 Tax=Aspergillus karnatakaensis TaxID=1810916 RepID=UPI003CCD2583